MRMLVVVLCSVLVLVPAAADDEPVSVEKARADLASPDRERRAQALEALLHRDARVALEALAPFLDDPQIGLRARRAFQLHAPKRVAVEVLDAALNDPTVPVGHGWLEARACVERGSGECDVIMPGASYRLITRPELDRFLPLVGLAMARKRDAVVGASVTLLLTFDHQAKGLADAVARSWPQLPPYTRVMALVERWPVVRSPALATVLKRAMTMPETSCPWHHTDHMPSLVLKRAVEFAPVRARALILEDMQRVAPRLTRDALLALPEKALPALEVVWKRNLKNREFRNLIKLISLVERYATPAMKPTILALYRSAEGRWATDVEAAILRYLLKHDRSLGLAEIEKVLDARRRAGTVRHCTLLQDVLPSHWSPQAEALALKRLDDPDLEIVRSAAHALIRAGSRAAFEPLLKRILALDPAGKITLHIRSDLLMRLALDETRWVADAGFKQQLIRALLPAERAYLQLGTGP